MKKLKSRKLWASVLAAVANIVIPAVCPPAVAALPAINKLVMLYVGAEAVADAAGAFNG